MPYSIEDVSKHVKKMIDLVETWDPSRPVKENPEWAKEINLLKDMILDCPALSGYLNAVISILLNKE